MRKLTALILCVLYMVLLFSGCKKTAENPPVENPPAASTEPSTAPTESPSETIKPYTGPIITTRPTEPPPEIKPTVIPVELYLHYVQTARDYMNARRETLVSGDTTAFSEIAISGIVNDEAKHREYLAEKNITIPEVTYTVDEVKIVDEHGAYVTLREINTIASIEVKHILLITTNEKDLPFVVSDNYMEPHTGFVSASYVSK